MNVQLLEYVITISEEKSLSWAAEKHLITQPALSQQLKKLEIELGTKLFSRERNEMNLTDAGKIYVNGARSVLSIYRNMLQDISNMRIMKKKQITMVYNNVLLPAFTTEILPAFTALHADHYISTIDGNTTIAKEYLLNNMADIAIIAAAESSHSMLEYIPLGKAELFLALPLSHPCISSFRRNGVDFRLLTGDAFILNQKNSYFRTLEQEIFNTHQFIPNILCEISDLNASRHMVSNGKGIAFLPWSMKQDEAYECFTLNPAADFYIMAAYHKGLNPPKALRDLIRILQQSSG